MKHPFKPLIGKSTKALLVGTLPPEEAPFYFSNSCNTRLWDILRTISEERSIIYKNSIFLPDHRKKEILESLKLGIYDIICEYDRDDMSSTKDIDINPLKYSDIIQLAERYSISRLLFVYKNAAKWFLHSLESNSPRRISGMHYNINQGVFKTVSRNGLKITCILLPNPLNRGTKDQTLKKKVDIYRDAIVNCRF